MKQALAGRALRWAVVGVLLTVSATLGVGVAVRPLFTPKTPASPNQPGQAPGTVSEQRFALGRFDRSLDIGGPARAGSAQLDGGTYTVRGGGTHIYGPADQFRFVCRKWTGDGEIFARIHSDPVQEAVQVCAGVMFRESLAAESHHMAILLSARGKHHLKWRDADSPASACVLADADASDKHWVRLVRRGNKFTAYTRADGTKEWELVKELELPLSPSVYVGLAVTAHDDAQLATTTFDQVSLEPTKP
jgi:hypothetical protein